MTHHGEYKVPGGKLVKVDFAVEDNQLRDVVVSGDFFLYPEETLEDIRSALEGMDAGTAEDGIADRIRGSLDAGAELLGTSPEAIAVAVRRALSESTLPA
ncbi:MAG TPA: biotin--protein ligase [Thermomicrobiales bacterium]|jgi:lipoate-protein ligase A|nr:biotin--protein ligase [Thermomicrobiales bacterium]